MMTKGVSREKLDKYTVMCKQKALCGRAKEALKVKRDNALKGKVEDDGVDFKAPDASHRRRSERQR